MAKNWTREEERAMAKMIRDKVDIEKIGQYLGKPANAVYLKAYRMRIPLKDVCQRPTMRLIMEAKFGDVSMIQAHRYFYEKTGISQKRWPRLLYGYDEPTQDEIERVAEYFHIDQSFWARFLGSVQLSFDFS